MGRLLGIGLALNNEGLDEGLSDTIRLGRRDDIPLGIEDGWRLQTDVGVDEGAVHEGTTRIMSKYLRLLS